MNLLSLSLWHSWHCCRCCSLSESETDWHDLQGCKWTANHSSENRILKNKQSSNIAWILLFLGFGNCKLGNFDCWSWKLVLVCPFTKRKDFDPWFWQWLVCFNLPYGLTKANRSTAMLAFMFRTLLKDGKKGHPSANSWQSFLSAVRVSAKCGGGTGGSWPAWAVESSATFIPVRSWLSQSELCAAKGLAPAAIAARTAGDWPKMEATLCQSKIFSDCEPLPVASLHFWRIAKCFSRKKLDFNSNYSKHLNIQNTINMSRNAVPSPWVLSFAPVLQALSARTPLEVVLSRVAHGGQQILGYKFETHADRQSTSLKNIELEPGWAMRSHCI